MGRDEAGHIEVTIKCCTGRSVVGVFRQDATGQAVFDLAQKELDIKHGANFGVQLPSGHWLIKSKERSE